MQIKPSTADEDAFFLFSFFSRDKSLNFLYNFAHFITQVMRWIKLFFFLRWLVAWWGFFFRKLLKGGWRFFKVFSSKVLSLKNFFKRDENCLSSECAPIPVRYFFFFLGPFSIRKLPIDEIRVWILTYYGFYFFPPQQ